ncbi:MAG: alpha/beta fold hydrolase [Christensenellales bacterium]
MKEAIAMRKGSQELWLDVDAMRIHCLTAGESSRPPVMLLHGGGIDSATLSWGDAIAPLSEIAQVFAPDLPGYGLSDTPDIQYTTDFYIQFLSRLLDALHLDKISLVGLSMGGAISLGFTLRFPDRVKKLVLAAPGGIQDYAVTWSRWMFVAGYLFVHLPFINDLSYRYMGRSWESIRKQLAASGAFYRAERLSPQLVEDVYRHANLPGRGKAFSSWQRSEYLWKGSGTYFVDRLHEITVPTLFINGDKDRAVPLACAQEAHRLVTGSKLHVLKDCGHWAQREMPEAFNRAVGEFLSDSHKE